MPIFFPGDTRAVLGANAEKCDSRSLYMDRFAEPGAEEEERRSWFSTGIAKGAAIPAPRRDTTCGCGAPPLYAQLQSRLMVNMAGGVMENAGMCLDRFGLPYIPGSAVKGCARRAAIQSLMDARDANQDVANLARLLANVALVFGWGEGEWKVELTDSHRLKSDFVYAIGTELWTQVSLAAQELLPKTDHFAGGVSFLPAHPVDVSSQKLPLDIPPLGKLELDVLTGHHQKYYGRKESPGGALVMPVALDIEDPIPVIFPAVAAGHVFKFCLVALRGCRADCADQARAWLMEGLQTFGLGAKTSAGYGWLADVSSLVQNALDEEQQAAMAAQFRRSLEPDQTFLTKLSGMKEADLRGVINPYHYEEANWTQKNEQEQYTLLHFLRVTAPEVLRSDRDNPKSKIAKAIANLAKKFPA